MSASQFGHWADPRPRHFQPARAVVDVSLDRSRIDLLVRVQ